MKKKNDKLGFLAVLIAIAGFGYVLYSVDNASEKDRQKNLAIQKAKEKDKEREDSIKYFTQLRIDDSLNAIKKIKDAKAWELKNPKAFKIWKNHPEWSKEDCELIAGRKIWIGMHIDMLKYQRGLPNSANPSNFGRGTQWQWCWHDYSPMCFYDKDNDGLIDSYN